MILLDTHMWVWWVNRSLTPEVAVAACQLPGDFHRDPADELIVATARTLNLPLLTADAKILAYPHVTLLK